MSCKHTNRTLVEHRPITCMNLYKCNECDKTFEVSDFEEHGNGKMVLCNIDRNFIANTVKIQILPPVILKEQWIRNYHKFHYHMEQSYAVSTEMTDMVEYLKKKKKVGEHYIIQEDNEHDEEHNIVTCLYEKL